MIHADAKTGIRRFSLVDETVRLLREGLEGGAWNAFLPGERVLCGQWGVSRPTLRAAIKVLEQEGLLEVTHGSRTKVLKPAPRRDAGLVTVGLLSPDPVERMPPFVLLWVDELRRQLAAEGHLLHVHVAKAAFGGPHPEAAIEKSVGSFSRCVWVLYRSTREMQQWFAMRGAPCVVVGSLHEGVRLPSVDKDYRALCRHAVGLLAGRGHLRVVLLMDKRRLGGDRESETGFMEGVEAAKNRALEGRIVTHDGSAEGIERSVDQLLALGRQGPTAWLVAGSMHALTVLTLLLRRGVDVPGRIVLLCRDDDEFLDHVVPRLARYAVKPGGFAKRVFRLVMQAVREGQATPGGGDVMPVFLDRESI